MICPSEKPRVPLGVGLGQIFVGAGNPAKGRADQYPARPYRVPFVVGAYGCTPSESRDPNHHSRLRDGERRRYVHDPDFHHRRGGPDFLAIRPFL